MKFLRTHTYTYTISTLHIIVYSPGLAMSFLLTSLSFLIPYVQGKLVDVAVSQAARYAKDPAALDGAVLWEPIFLLSCLMFSSYGCEIMVGLGARTVRYTSN